MSTLWEDIDERAREAQMVYNALVDRYAAGDMSVFEEMQEAATELSQLYQIQNEEYNEEPNEDEYDEDPNPDDSYGPDEIDLEGVPESKYVSSIRPTPEDYGEEEVVVEGEDPSSYDSHPRLASQNTSASLYDRLFGDRYALDIQEPEEVEPPYLVDTTHPDQPSEYGDVGPSEYYQPHGFIKRIPRDEVHNVLTLGKQQTQAATDQWEAFQEGISQPMFSDTSVPEDFQTEFSSSNPLDYLSAVGDRYVGFPGGGVGGGTWDGATGLVSEYGSSAAMASLIPIGLGAAYAAYKYFGGKKKAKAMARAIKNKILEKEKELFTSVGLDEMGNPPPPPPAPAATEPPAAAAPAGVGPAEPSGAGALGSGGGETEGDLEMRTVDEGKWSMAPRSMLTGAIDEDSELMSGYESLKGRICTLWKTMKNRDGSIGQRGKYWEHKTRPDSWLPAKRGRIGGHMARMGRGYRPKMKKHWGKRLKTIGTRWKSMVDKNNQSFQGQVASKLRHRGRDLKLGILGQRVLTSITR